MSTYSYSNIVHMDMDTFFVSVERVLDPSLKNRPVIVGGDPFGRGVVAGCSREARAYGVHSAMPIRRAYRLCPQAAYLHGNYVHYGEYSRVVTDLLRDLAPAVEKSSVDEFYIDLSRTERLHGSAYEWAQRMQQEIMGETELPLSLGLATNKLVAKVATTQVAKNNEAHHHRVEAGSERAFFAPYPIRALPGIGEKTEASLLPFGIRTLGELALTPVQLLERLYGKTGRALFEHSQGIDHAPVITTRDQKSYSREQTFMEDTLDLSRLFATLLALASQLADDLRQAAVLTEKITLKLRYSDFTTVTRTRTCSWTNQDQSIYKIVEKLFKELWTRRVRVRLLGIEASSLITDVEQHPLFTATTDGSDKKAFDPLYTTFDHLRDKYGKRVIGFASALKL
jgi:DNA polymerase-4